MDWYDNTGVGAGGVDDFTEDLEEEDDQTLDNLLQFSTSSLPEKEDILLSFPPSLLLSSLLTSPGPCTAQSLQKRRIILLPVFLSSPADRIRGVSLHSAVLPLVARVVLTSCTM